METNQPIYSVNEIKVFKNLEREGTLYVGLGFAENGKGDIWSDSYIYIRDDIFAILLSPEFYAANNNYSLYAYNEYNQSQLDLLNARLVDTKKSLELINSYSALLQYLNRPNTDYKASGVLPDYSNNLENDWPEILKRLKIINEEVITLVNTCIDKNQIMYCLGI